MLKTEKQEKNGQWFRDQIREFLLRNGATEQLNNLLSAHLLSILLEFPCGGRSLVNALR